MKKVLFSFLVFFSFLFSSCAPFSISGNTATSDNYYEFDRFGYHWKCDGLIQGDLSNEKPYDIDMSDGKIYVPDQVYHSGGAYYANCGSTSTVTLNDKGFIISSVSSGKYAGCKSRIVCRTTNFDTNNLEEVDVYQSVVISLSKYYTQSQLFDGALVTSYENKQEGAQFTKTLTDFTIKKSGNNWVQYDFINQQTIILDQLSFGAMTYRYDGEYGTASIIVEVNDIKTIKTAEPVIESVPAVSPQPTPLITPTPIIPTPTPTVTPIYSTPTPIVSTPTLESSEGNLDETDYKLIGFIIVSSLLAVILLIVAIVVSFRMKKR